MKRVWVKCSSLIRRHPALYHTVWWSWDQRTASGYNWSQWWTLTTSTCFALTKPSVRLLSPHHDQVMVMRNDNLKMSSFKVTVGRTYCICWAGHTRSQTLTEAFDGHGHTRDTDSHLKNTTWFLKLQQRETKSSENKFSRICSVLKSSLNQTPESTSVCRHQSPLQVKGTTHIKTRRVVMSMTEH